MSSLHMEYMNQDEIPLVNKIQNKQHLILKKFSIVKLSIVIDKCNTYLQFSFGIFPYRQC